MSRFKEKVLSSLPEGLEPNYLYFDKDKNEWDMEWYRTTDRILALDIDEKGVACWAALVDGESPRGVFFLEKEEVPEQIVDLIKRIYDDNSSKI